METEPLRTPLGYDGKQLGIATPRDGGAAGQDVEMSGGSASASRVAAGAPQLASFIPYASYVMPSEPTWRVKPQFAGWEIDHSRFQMQRLIGKGSYGSVAEGIDHLTGKRVAIKKVRAAAAAATVGGRRVKRSGDTALLRCHRRPRRPMPTAC